MEISTNNTLRQIFLQVSAKEIGYKCIFCNGEHKPQECTGVTDLSIRKQIQLNIIEHASIKDENNRPVIRPDKITSKIRMVYDASAKIYGPSLNECLHIGPSSSRSLYEVLLQFRGHNFAVCADIEKSFLQIGLHPHDRDLVRFLWFKDGANNDVKRFENNEFGATSSSFLLNATLLHQSKKIMEEEKEFVYQFIEALHVDDLDSEADTEQEAYHLYVKAKSLLSEGGFKLRQFQFNSIYLESLIRSIIHPSDIDMPRITKILGLLWDRDKG